MKHRFHENIYPESGISLKAEIWAVKSELGHLFEVYACLCSATCYSGSATLVTYLRGSMVRVLALIIIF